MTHMNVRKWSDRVIRVLHPYDRALKLRKLSDRGKNAAFVKNLVIARAAGRMKGSGDLKIDPDKVESFFLQAVRCQPKAVHPLGAEPPT